MPVLERSAGVLLHVTSLPGWGGIGDMGPMAYDFVDRLAAAGWKYWQMLPLHPTEPRFDNSPYHSTSAFAGNFLFISPEILKELGYGSWETDGNPPLKNLGSVRFKQALVNKRKVLQKAFRHFLQERIPADFLEFCQGQSSWLEDYALFSTLKSRFQGRSWHTWPAPLRDRHPEALAQARQVEEEKLQEIRFIQYMFYLQWQKLRSYALNRGVYFLGDMPIYVTYDSADVWSNPQLFQLDQKKRPTHIAGVPPDYFSAHGQLWGNPLYRWEEMQRRHFDWWISRLSHTLEFVDQVRIDHFRGLIAFWSVPAGSKTARTGRWVTAPAREFLSQVKKAFPDLPLIAEDLGSITPEVIETREQFQLPGMKVLQFAFDRDDPGHPFLPHNYEQRTVAYTGTHDNNTSRGWFEQETDPTVRKRLGKYLGRKVTSQQVAAEMVRLVLTSQSVLSVIPLQDLLNLGQEARMNFPGRKSGNWRWQLTQEQLGTLFSQEVTRLLQETTRVARSKP